MMNSETMFDAQKRIDDVIELIGDEYQYYHINEPIQRESCKNTRIPTLKHRSIMSFSSKRSVDAFSIYISMVLIPDKH